MPSGKISFAKIDQLPAKWWDTPSSVWTVWDQNTYYLWGANSSNYDLKQGDNLFGGGMAGPSGPTRGYAHDHYIGIDTMDYSEVRNAGQFKKLQVLLSSGKNIVIPTYKGGYSLGTGIAHQNTEWAKIQLQIWQGLNSLIFSASSLEVPSHTFWPDCRTTVDAPDGMGGTTKISICSTQYRSQLDESTTGSIIIKDANDIKTIIADLE